MIPIPKSQRALQGGSKGMITLLKPGGFHKRMGMFSLTKLTEFPTDRGLGFVDQIPQRYPPNMDKTFHLTPQRLYN